MPPLSRSLLLCSLLACVAATLGHTAEATATREETAEATATTAEALRGRTENIAQAAAVVVVRGRIEATAEAAITTAEAPRGQTDVTLSAVVEAAAAATTGHTAEATPVPTTGMILSSSRGAGTAQQMTRKIPLTSKQREDFTATTFTTGATITEPTAVHTNQSSEALGVRPRSTPADVLQTYTRNRSNDRSTLAKGWRDFSSAASPTAEAARPFGLDLISTAIAHSPSMPAPDVSTPPPLITVRNVKLSTATTHSAAVLPISPTANTRESEKARLSTSYPPTEVVDLIVGGQTTASEENLTPYSKSEQNPTVAIATPRTVAEPPPTTSGETEATSGGALLLLQKITRTPDGGDGYRFTTSAAATTSKVNLEKTAIPVGTTVQYTNRSRAYNKTVMRTEKTESSSIASKGSEQFVTEGPLGFTTDTTPPPSQRGKEVDPTSVAKPTAAEDARWQHNVSVDAGDRYTSAVPHTSPETATGSHGNTSAALTTLSSREKVSQSTTDNSSVTGRVTNSARETASKNSSHSAPASTPFALTTRAGARGEDGAATSVPPRSHIGTTWSYLSRTAATDSAAKRVTSQAASTLAADETSSSQVLSSSASTQIIPTDTTLRHATKTAQTIGTMKDPRTTPADPVTSAATSVKYFSSEPGMSSGSSEMTAIIPTVTAPLTRAANNSAAPPTRLAVPTSLDPCLQHNCKNGGTCHENNGSVTCQCEDGWSDIDCSKDVNECSESPCPPLTSCSNAPGSFACTCPPGYDRGAAAGDCAQVKVFPGIMRARKTLFERDFDNETALLNKRALLQLVKVLNESFKGLHHFVKSVINNTRVDADSVHVSHVFGAYSAVTHRDVAERINGFVNGCESRNDTSVCAFATRHGLSYEAGSLCHGDACDPKTSDCADPGGFVGCTCKTGYFKFKDTDRTCRDCGSGYFLQNDGTCTRCSHGFGGFNCDDPLLLVMVGMAVTLCCLVLAMVWMVKKACGRRRARTRRLVPSGVQLSPYADLPPPARRGRPRCGSAGSRIKLTLQQQISTTSSERASEGWRYSDMEMYRMSKLGRYNLSYVGDEAGIRDYF